MQCMTKDLSDPRLGHILFRFKISEHATAAALKFLHNNNIYCETPRFSHYAHFPPRIHKRVTTYLFRTIHSL